MARRNVDRVALARKAEKAGRRRLAERLYRQAINEGDLHAFNNLAQLLIEDGRLKEGESLFRRGVAGGDALAAKNLALFLIEDQRPKAAAKVLQRARRMGLPASPKQLQMSRDYAERRTITEAFERARRSKRSDARWRLITALQKDGSRTALELAVAALQSRSPSDRALGAQVLSQLGFQNSTPPFRPQSIRALRAALKVERSPRALAAIAFALGRLWSRGSIRELVRLVNHPDRDVRHAVAAELIHTTRELGWGDETPDARVTTALVQLTRDHVAEVRDWACYSIGTSAQDSPEIRQALADRLRDRHLDTRVEAVAGLARRNDARAVEPFLQILGKYRWRFGTWVTPDLVLFAGRSGDPRFAPFLVEFRDNWHASVEEKRAIRVALRQLRTARSVK